jgi:SprT protein
MNITIKNKVTPNDSHLVALAMEKIEESFDLLNRVTGKQLTLASNEPLVFFNQSRTGGYVWPNRYGNRVFLNWPLFKANTEDYLNQTIPHEVAHLFQRVLAPNERSHGPIWQRLMRKIGLQPRRCHSYDTTISARYESFTYICTCTKHRISKIVHNKILKGKQYKCKSCKSDITFLG